MEGDLPWGGEPTIQCTDDVLQKCTPETYIILLTNVTPINSIKILKTMKIKQTKCPVETDKCTKRTASS